MTGSGHSRRAVLGATATTLLAGCSGVTELSSDEESQIHTHELPEVGDGATQPTVAKALPITIERRRLDTVRVRVTSLLEEVPMAFGPADIPNGYIRQRLLDATERATDALETARSTDSRLEALRSLRTARGEARYAAAGWGFAADRDPSEIDMRAEHDEVVRAAADLATAHDYRGTDLVDAAVVHALIERYLNTIQGQDSPRVPGTQTGLLAVAAWGEQAEDAAGRLTDVEYIMSRFEASLPADSTSVRQPLKDAREALKTSLQSGEEAVTAEPTDTEEGPAERLRYRMRDRATDAPADLKRADGPASAVLAATQGLVNQRAYGRLRDLLDEGTPIRATAAEDLAETRTQAIDAIETALTESRRPLLVRPALANAARTVAHADAEIDRYSGRVEARRLDDPMRRYTDATLQARSTPAACEDVLTALDG
jgi:hypothetical protein